MSKIQNRYLDFTPEELKKIKSKNDSLLNIFLMTGIRRFELYKLLNSQIDGGAWKIVGKGGTFRIVPYHQILEDNLDDLRRWWNAKSDTYINTYFNKIGMELGITKEVWNEKKKIFETKPNMNPHRFRATFATQLINNGIDLVTIQTLMGHSSLTMTARYIQINTKKLKNATKYILDPKYELEGMTIPELEEEIVRLRLRLERCKNDN